MNDPKEKLNFTDEYQVKDFCRNCGQFFSYAVPKGTLKPKDAKCAHCGCKDGK